MNLKIKTQIKANSGTLPEIASASTGKNGQLIRTHLDILALSILLFQNQDKSPPGGSLDPDANPEFGKNE